LFAAFAYIRIVCMILSMTKDDFIQYLSHPEELNGHSIADLEKLVHEYPYFQAGRMLYLKNLHNQNSIDYEKNLHITSAYTPSGKVLYNLIKKKSQVSSLKSQEIQIDSRQSTADKEQPKEIFPKLEPIAIIQEMPITNKEDASTPISVTKAKDEYDELQLLEKEMLREAYRTSMTIDLLEDKPQVSSSKSQVPKEQQTTNNKQGTYSFSDWLKVVSGQTPASAIEEKANQSAGLLSEKTQANQLIDNFLLDQTAKSAPKPKAEFYSAEAMAKKSIKDDETFVSETLATIYLKQGNLPKALRAYEILVVKHPEKIHIFAPLLEKIKKLLEDQKTK